MNQRRVVAPGSTVRGLGEQFTCSRWTSARRAHRMPGPALAVFLGATPSETGANKPSAASPGSCSCDHSHV
jgi:hypothetical protein